jgi:hypothetical protein
MVGATDTMLRDLRSKYVEMLRLRRDDEAHPHGDPRREMAALADRFPGALREIDELTMDQIQARIAALDLSIRDPDAIEPWMIATVRFHALARGALCAKRWLGKKKHVDEDTVRAFVRDARSLAYPEDAIAWADVLARVASPPRGKVTDLVYERLAATLGVTVRDARHLVFGPSRRERREQS